MDRNKLINSMKLLLSSIFLVKVLLTIGWLYGVFNFESLATAYLVLLVVLFISVNIILVLKLVQNQVEVSYE